MKRKVVNPNIQVKKRQQAIEKEQEKDLKHELETEQISTTPHIPKKRRNQDR